MLKMYYSTLFNSFKESEIPEEKRDALTPVYKSIFNQFLDFNGLSLSSPVGEEIYNHESLGLFLETLDAKYSKGTVPGMRSKLRKIRNYAIKLSYNHDIAELQFGDSLLFVLKYKKMSGRKLAGLLGISSSAVNNWISGKKLPSTTHLDLIEKIEEILDIPTGVLLSKLGRVPHGEKRKRFEARERTPHGEENQKLSQKNYKLPYDDFPGNIKKDIEEMISFFTSDFPKMVQPKFVRAKKQKWKIKRGESGTAKMVVKDVTQFFGFLTADPNHEDPMQAGLGIPVKKLSLSCLVNIEFIYKYIQFRMLRKNGKLTTDIKRVLERIKALIRKKYGYLRQHTEIGKEYFVVSDGVFLTPYSKNRDNWSEQWDDLCEATYEFICDTIESSTFVSGVDTFKSIEKVVEGNIMPQIKEILIWSKRDADLKGLGVHTKAIKQRDYLLSLLLFLFELRIEHYEIMEFGRHIFELNGRMVLRIYREELKRPEILDSPYVTLTIPSDVANQIKIYKEQYRPHLYGADTSSRVFLGSVTGRKTEASLNGIEARSLAFAFKNVMLHYSDSDTGFGPHAVRKIVTSVLDRKRDLTDFDQAATLAMHTKKVSRDSYASNQVESAFNHYVHRLQQAGILKMPKGERRTIAVDEIEFNDLKLHNEELEKKLIEALEKLKDAEIKKETIELAS